MEMQSCGSSRLWGLVRDPYCTFRDLSRAAMRLRHGRGGVYTQAPFMNTCETGYDDAMMEPDVLNTDDYQNIVDTTDAILGASQEKRVYDTCNLNRVQKLLRFRAISYRQDRGRDGRSGPACVEIARVTSR